MPRHDEALRELREELSRAVIAARGDVEYRPAVVASRYAKLAALDATLAELDTLRAGLQQAKRDAVTLRDARFAQSSAGLVSSEMAARVNAYAEEVGSPLDERERVGLGVEGA